MRKFFCISAVLAILLTGCHKKAEEPVAVVDPEILNAPETMPEFQTETESLRETVPIAERASVLVNSETLHILDECQVLPEDAFQAYNDYLNDFSDSCEVNAFLVITEHLDGYTPQQFAESFYRSVSNAEYPDGILFLINNDTNQDYVFTAGRCCQAVSQEQINTVLSGATYDLINQNYTGALNQILSLCQNISY